MPPKIPTKGAFKAKALLIDMKPTAYNTRFRANALYDVMNKINTQGLPVLLVHDSSKLPVGSWYEASVENDALYTKFFIPKEVREYEDVKTRVDAKILDSVSIGFNAGEHNCSICGNDIQDYNNCAHIPGQVYDSKDLVDGTSLGEQTCFVMLDKVVASEASLVHSGAVPEAKIIESSDKADYFIQNKLNFAEGSIETVHGGAFVQDLNVNNNFKGEKDMEEEFKELTTKHDELTTKFADKSTKLDELTNKYNDTRESNIELKEMNLEYKEKVDGFDEAVLAKESAETKFAETIASLGEKVEALALPFDADYKAPEDLEALFVDLEKYLEEAKALPTGRQSRSEDELAYSEPDANYKI